MSIRQRPSYGGGRGELDSPSSHLWVGNLPTDISETHLSVLFGKHGPLDGITSYASRGYAFVYFKRVEDAATAKDALQGFMIRGNHLKIEFAKLAKPSKLVWVGGFSSSVTKEKLEEEFSKFGKIEEFKFIRDRNSAVIDFVRLEDASEAVKNLNGLQIGVDRIRVDFLRSHPFRREQLDFPDLGSAQFRGVGAAIDLPWANPDIMRSYPEPTFTGHKRPLTPQSFVGHKEGQPSKVLWVGYPPSVVIDEEMLHNAMILYGEIERIRCVRDRHYSFVEFRSAEEARRAKEALQGRLFNDPRITIRYSNSDFVQGKDFGLPYSGFGGHGPDIFGNEVPFRPPFRDMASLNRGMPPNTFRGPLSTNGMLGQGGPKPFGPRGSFDRPLPPYDLNEPNTLSSMPDLNANAPLGLNRRKLSPPAAGLLPTPSRTSYKTTGWDVVDPNQPSRVLKRSRIDGQTSYPSLTIGKGDEYVAGVDQPYGDGPQLAGGPLPRIHGDNVLSPPGDMQFAKGHTVHPNEDCIWRGVIAKGGTPVCHARCISIGKGLECKLPEVVNCSARTGLDMLTKHYASAEGFDVVFFLPDSEEDFANYTEFLRYLGSKNRAGVAKLDDGTTLFLVPPSEFLTDVLKISGRERLYGVVLRLPQQPPSGPPAPQQQIRQPLLPVPRMERQLAPPALEYIAPMKELGIHMDYARPIPNESMPLLKGPLPTESVGQDQSNDIGSSAPRPGLTLTPELIATLASLLPGGSQTPTPQTAQPQLSAPTIEKPPYSQGWNQQPQVLDQALQSSQQLNGQMLPKPQISNTLQSYSCNFSAGSLPIQGVHPDSMSMPNSMYSFQEQGKASAVHPVAQQSQQFMPSSQAPQSYHFEAPHNTQMSYGMEHGPPAGSYSVGEIQQPNNPAPFTGQYHGTNANMSATDNVLPSSNVNMNVEPLNQVERNQPLPSGVGQSAEVEVVKNQRYQSTLQFAANLLLQIQQQQQQQQANPHVGNQQ